VALTSNLWDGNVPSLGNSWEPGKSKTAAVILVNYKKCSSLHDIILEICFCIYTQVMAYEEFNGSVYNSVRLCSCDQNSKWPTFSPTIAKIEHNLIDLCYINMILFCTYPCFAISDNHRNHSYDAWLLKPITIQTGRDFILKYVSATMLSLFLSVSIWART